MSNQYLSQELYNADLKNKFINFIITESLRKKGINEEEIRKTLENEKTGSRRAYRYIFQRSYKMESRLGKDIYNFDDEELRTLRLGYSNGSLGAVLNVTSILRTYLDYCVEKQYARINLLQDIKGAEEALQYVNKSSLNKKFINKDDLIEIVDTCDNAQDAIIPALLFYGIKGENNSELVNLRVEDVKFDEHKIYIKERDSEGRDPYVEADDFLLEIIRDAIDQRFYNKNNGVEKETLKSKSNIISVTEYVLRISSRTEEGAIKESNILARINRIRDYYGNRFLTSKSFWYSGMMHMAHIMSQNIDRFEKEDWEKINEKFDYSKKYWYKTRDRYSEWLKIEEERKEKEKEKEMQETNV